MPHHDQTTTQGRAPSVRRASPGDAGVLVDVLTSAFVDDAPMRWAFPDPGRRREIVPEFFRAFFDLSVAHEGAFTTEERDAVLLGLPPEASVPTGEESERFEARLALAAGEYADALRTILRMQAEHHPRDIGPHFYLGFGCVAPEHRGAGLLGGLVGHVLRDCDRQEVAAYLEASSPGGEAVARAHGFAPIGQPIDLPDGPSLRPMWRPARRSA